MMRNNVAVIGELNVDIIFNQNEAFPSVGKEVIARKMDVTMGSSSAIFASNLSCLGAAVTFMGKLGEDVFGNIMLESLQGNGVNTSAIIRRKDLKTGATVVLNFGEDRAMVTHPGAMDDLRAEDIDWDIIRASSHLHISSYFIQKGLQKEIGNIFRKAKELGLSTSFDMQWDPAEQWIIDLENILPYVDIFLPNEAELLQVTRSLSIAEAIKRIEAIANTVVVKQGSKGSSCFSQGLSLFKPAFINDNVVDAIGAGDSFNAGFIYKYLQNKSLEHCQNFGNVIGAISTTAAGGTTAFSNRNNILKIAKERFGYADE